MDVHTEFLGFKGLKKVEFALCLDITFYWFHDFLWSSAIPHHSI